MSCNNMRDHLIEYLLGTLHEDASARVEIHLSACSTCLRTLENLKKARGVWKKWEPVIPAFNFSQTKQNILANAKAQKLIEEKSSQASVFVTIVCTVFKTQVNTLGKSSKEFMRRLIKGNKIKVSAAIVAIVIAVLIGINVSNKLGAPEVAWGNLVEQIDKINFYKYQRRTIFTTGVHEEMLTEKADVYRSSRYGVRIDRYFPIADYNITEYVLLADNTSIGVFPKIKKYVRTHITKEQSERMRKLNDIGAYIQMLISSDYKKLGSKMLGRRRAEGIESIDSKYMKEWFESYNVSVWVDVETDLPIMHEFEGVVGGGKVKVKTTLDNFEWDKESEASIFEPDFSCYQLMAEVKVGPMNEETAILSLSRFATMNDGKYPSSLALPNVIRELNEIYQKRMGELFFWENEDFDWENHSFLRAHLETTCMFYGELVFQDREVAYYGSKVTVNDAGLPLMRWKIVKDEYRVICADLSIKNVNLRQLTELEAAFNK